MATIPHVSKFVKAVGVELEGGWTKVQTDSIAAEFIKFVSDNSVHLNEFVTGENKPYYKGEIPSPGAGFTTLAQLEEFLKLCWPKFVPTRYISTDTCGFHIHISLRTAKLYQHLMCRKFFNATEEFWKAWGMVKNLPANSPFWARSRGENQYCRYREDFSMSEQARAKFKGDSTSTRYTALNYCFGQHGTLELRVLPMFPNWELGFEAVKAWLNFVDNWLMAYKESNEDWHRKVEVEKVTVTEVKLPEKVIRATPVVNDHIESETLAPAVVELGNPSMTFTLSE
jgi:hypothetical protein